MRKKFELTEEDKQEFRTAMKGVKPLGSRPLDKKIPPNPSFSKGGMNRAAVSPLKKVPRRDFSAPEFYDSDTLPPVTGNDLIDYSRPGLQHKVLRKLHAGQYNVQAILDLHGMNVDQARENLSQFLMRCYEKNISHVLIIHGKGHDSPVPVLKNKLNHWLRQTDQVLAFCSAGAKQGRGGALYILLKRRQ